MKGSRRVLLVLNDGRFFASHRHPVAEAARAAGYDIHVASPSTGDDVADIVGNGFPHHAFPLSRRGTNPHDELRSIHALARLYRCLRPDVVHLFTIKPVVYGGIAARVARVPTTVSTITGLGHTFIAGGLGGAALRAVVKPLYRAALGHPGAHVIFQNPTDRDLFLRGGLVGPSRTLLIPGSGVDATRITPTPEPPRPVAVVCAARMLREKGIVEFVEAARRLKAKGVVARFILVGDADPGNPSTVSREDLAAWHAEGVVEWLGWRPDVAALLASAHVACLPSYREGVPRFLLEAGAQARPSVATDVPGCRDVVHDGENGLLVPPRDAGALASAIERLVDDAGARRRMGARAREIVLATFDVRHVVRATLALYGSVLREPSERRSEASQ